MTWKLSKRQAVRVISFAIAVVLLVTGAAVAGFQLVSRYRSTIEYGYQQALNELSDYFTNLQAALTKGIYANTQTQQYGLALKLVSDAQGAKAALSRLPLSDGEGDAMQKYLAQVGDFAQYMTAKLSRDQAFSNDDKDSLQKLSSYAKEIAGQIEEISARYADGDTFIGQAQTIRGNLESVSHTAQENTLDQSFTQLNESFEDYPSLVYDGPFADQVQQKKPRMLENTESFSKLEAQKNAAAFLNVPKNTLSYQGQRQGNIPAYIFKNEDVYITVTIKGGYIEEMYKTTQATEKKLDFTQAVEKAQQFLRQRDFTDMKESYYVTSGNICTINFACTQADVICYSDLIKVGVALDTGEIVSFNASGYIMNHSKRDIPTDLLDQAQAMESVSPLLTVEKTARALIPTGGTKEVLCYEFTCKGQGEDNVLVYINAQTGLEEQILILLQSDGGVLTM